MPRTDLKFQNSWIIRLVLIMAMTTVSQAWGGMGPGGGMGGPMGGGGGMGGPMSGGGRPGPERGARRAQPRFDLSKAVTISGQVESLGSYGVGSWRSMTGMAVQGLILKTERGNIEVYLGPPSYVTKQNFFLQKGDALEVKGLKALYEYKETFVAAEVKKDQQKLRLLDENGSPLWRQQEAGGAGPERGGRRGREAGPWGGGGPGGGGGLGRGR